MANERLIFICDHHIYGDDVDALFNSLLNDLIHIKKIDIHHDIELVEQYSIDDTNQLVLKYNSNTGLCRLYAGQLKVFQIIKLTFDSNIIPKPFQNYDKIIEAEKKEIKIKTLKQSDIIKSSLNANKLSLENIFMKEKSQYDFPESIPTESMIEMGKIVANLLSDIKEIICVIVPTDGNSNYSIDLEIMITSIKNSQQFNQIFNNLYTVKNDTIKGASGVITRPDKTISSTSIIRWIETNLGSSIKGGSKKNVPNSDSESDSSLFSLSDSD